MSRAVGTGMYRYELVDSWPHLPRGWEFKDAAGASVNSRGEVHVFSRGDHPVTVWEPAGGFITSWGYGHFTFPHGIHIAPNDDVWLVDNIIHTASRFTSDGELVQTLGEKGNPSPSYVGRPFNMPTALATAPNDEIFVSDGYGAHLVHRFSPEGELLHSWGKEGDGPGEFVNLHDVAIDSLGRVYICDRENHRIQLFDGDGNFLEQWTDVRAPSDLWIEDDIVYALDNPEGGSRVTLYTLEADVIARFHRPDFGVEDHLRTGHGICVDHEGSIYVTEVIGPQQVTKLQRA